MSTQESPQGFSADGLDGGSPREASLGELVAKVTSQLSALVRDEFRYAGLQLKAKATKSGIGGALLAVAGVLALYGFGVLLMAAGFGLAKVVDTWLAFLIVSLVIFAICGVLALVAVNRLKSAKKNQVNPKAGMEKNIDALKKGFQK